jgi:ATP-dependent exoDNAse (exonuclease V) beta subunit
MERIEEGKNWNIEGDIVSFGANIFNEQFLEKEMLVREKISDKQFLNDYKGLVIGIRKRLEDEVHKCGEEFKTLCARDGFCMSDFKQESKGIYAFFTKICDGNDFSYGKNVDKCVNAPKEWVKDAKNINAISNGYIDLLNKTLATINAAERAIATSITITAHINNLMMLDMINNKVRALNSGANRFLLADTARFLRDIIDGSDIPFIYERTGNKFKHIMIDEFQDTSALQWENFKPLLSNSLSQNHTCLIVGDVKQSIYRWRNSDWNILNNIQGGEFGDKVDPTTIDKLDTNHRSKERVVDFNNKFFLKASNGIAKVYDEICGRKTDDIHTLWRCRCSP